MVKLNYSISKVWHTFTQLFREIKPCPSMDRNNYILSVLACMKDASYSPVQLQKILFLLERNISQKMGGPFFHFEPYHYGPFDKDVYREIDKLVATNDIVLYQQGYSNVNRYLLSEKGYHKGMDVFNSYNDEQKAYIKEVCAFVRSLSFEQLLNSIYKAYPEMKVKSIFSS